MGRTLESLIRVGRDYDCAKRADGLTKDRARLGYKHRTGALRVALQTSPRLATPSPISSWHRTMLALSTAGPQFDMWAQRLHRGGGVRGTRPGTVWSLVGSGVSPMPVCHGRAFAASQTSRHYLLSCTIITFGILNA